jgi:hypothetical protein
LAVFLIRNHVPGDDRSDPPNAMVDERSGSGGGAEPQEPIAMNEADLGPEVLQ